MKEGRESRATGSMSRYRVHETGLPSERSPETEEKSFITYRLRSPQAGGDCREMGAERKGHDEAGLEGSRSHRGLSYRPSPHSHRSAGRVQAAFVYPSKSSIRSLTTLLASDGLPALF